MYAQGVEWCKKLNNSISTSIVDYGLEVEVAVQGKPVPAGYSVRRFDYNSSEHCLQTNEFPFYPLNSMDESSELLHHFRRDLLHSVGEELRDDEPHFLIQISDSYW